MNDFQNCNDWYLWSQSDHMYLQHEKVLQTKNKALIKELKNISNLKNEIKNKIKKKSQRENWVLRNKKN